MDKFQIVSKFKGYIERDDITNVEPGFLVKGSQNVVSTDAKRVGNRKGYTLYGASNSALTPIETSYDWSSHRGVTQHLRSYDDELEFLYEGNYHRLANGFSSVEFNYAEFWDTTEQQDILLMVNGSKSIYVWSGGVTTFASATTTTIIKEGSTTWAEDGFFQSGTRQVTINGIVYTYTGGEQTTQLTGVTPDPTLGGHSVGDVIHQTLREVTNTPVSSVAYTANTIAFVNSNPDTITDSANGFVTAGFKAGDVIQITNSVSNNRTYTIATVAAGTLTLISSDAVTVEGAGANLTITAVRDWTNDLILTLRNQVYIGSFLSRDVYVSEVGDYDNFTPPSVPRMVGESALLTLDSTPVGFVVQEENMYITGQRGEWYLVNFQLSADLQDETLVVQRLKTAPLQAAIGQAAIFKIKNDVVFVSNEPTLDTLGRVENINTPQSLPLSEPVESLFNRLDFTNAAGVYFRDNIYIAVPQESMVLIYNIREGFWESPQILPISRFSIIDGDLYGHSNAVPETYKLFDGWNDNGNPYSAIAKFSYQNYGDRVQKKVHNEWYSEGYITANTIVTLTLNYDYEGFTQITSYTIDGGNDAIIFNPVSDASLGKHPLGHISLGGPLDPEDETIPPKFRIIHTMTEQDYYEIQAVYSSDEVDQRWELLAFGGQVKNSQHNNSEITI